MGSQEEALIKCIDLLAEHGENFSDLFYSNLFKRHAEFAALFIDADMVNQRSMLISALTFALESLENSEALSRRMTLLGELHRRAKVKPEHFGPFVSCLRDTAKQLAGEEWTDEMDRAWVDAMTKISEMMVKEMGGKIGGQNRPLNDTGDDPFA